ncbi:DUF389 domain-containing protein [Hirschia litorea]|uniref:DUF389 domain-containing protein n=1 Tax=Hirschia litorea TaxID=1199156 RepID=A0ABW2IHY9_9PROT
MSQTQTESPKRSKSPFRSFNIALKLLSRGINHENVVASVRDGGQLSGRYLFMIVMSCAIATLGLLLSSPAVIIGAMLISPLMGPIMLMGFSLSTLDLIALRRSVFSMACGVLSALTISIIIVKLSPLTEATPEILARTRPNFFDLLVAIFSGLAGGYAVIHKKGETIVGVAIATALMPPLAVAGYGIAVGATQVAGGAFFLFMTNLLAIALSVTLLSRLHGFGREHGRTMTVWQTGLILLVFGALSVPLVVALRDIAYETNVTHTVKESLTEPFQTGQARVSDMSIGFPRSGPIAVEATVLTRNRDQSAEKKLEDTLSTRLGRAVSIDLDQILVNEDQDVQQFKFLKLAESSLAAPLRAELNSFKNLAEERRTENEIRNAASFPVKAADIQATTQSATFYGAASSDFPISAWRASETAMATNFPDWGVTINPPITELPLIAFNEGKSELTEAALKVIGDCVWALNKWEVGTVEVVGYASTSGDVQRFDNNALAYQRAEAAAAILREAGINARPVGEYRAFNQNSDERAFGRLRFQSVLIRPARED